VYSSTRLPPPFLQADDFEALFELELQRQRRSVAGGGERGVGGEGSDPHLSRKPPRVMAFTVTPANALQEVDALKVLPLNG
jgi:hypothetical protein